MRVNRSLLPLVCGALTALACVLVSAPAAAYPQFQLSTGSSRCNECHFGPAGGGLINDYGRDEAEGSISTTAGSGRFFHGLFEMPEWLAMGADLRGAAVLKGAADTHPQVLLFPMQGDIYSRVGFGAWSVNAIAGLRAAARLVGTPIAERIVSREHYVMWQPEDTGLYIRGGRFFAPYGLRLQDHTAYTRRYLGQHSLEETYTLSVGKLEDEWEVHASVYTPPSTLSLPTNLGGDVGTPASGAALYYERRAMDGAAAYGVQGRMDLGENENSYWLGGVGKLWLEDAELLLLSQLDIGLQSYGFDSDPQMLLSAYLGASWFVHQGVILGAAVERYDPHLRLSGSARDAFNISVQWLFRSHWEVMAMGKVDVRDGLGTVAPTGMLMLHYYL